MQAAPVGRHGSNSTSQPLVRITHASIDIAERQRSYTLAEPPGAGPGTSLVLVFHGSKQTGEKFRAFTGNSFDALASTGGAVVAYLDGYKSQWNDARAANGFAARTENVDDVAFAQASHQMDSSKVYAAGFSNGGSMVIRLAHQVPGLLAGAAVIAATQPAPEN